MRYDYQTTVNYQGRVYYADHGTDCFGTLINRRTVMTAASCVPQTFNFTLPDNKNVTISVPIVLNDFYADYESIISVWIGVNTYLEYGYDISPMEFLYVEKIIIV